MKRPLIFFLSATMLAGCRIPVQPAPAPTLTVPPLWHGQSGVGPRAAAPIEANWWRAFGDPILDQMVAQALANNGDVRAARARVKEYQARLRVEQAADLPSLNLTGSAGRARTIGPFGTPVDSALFEGNLQASYELDFFGTRDHLTEAGRYTLESQEASAATTVLSVAANTASGYLNLRGLDAQLDLARETLASRLRSLELARRQFRVGYSSRLELSQAEAEYHVTAGVVPQLEHAIAQQENALSLLVGANPGAPTRGATLMSLRAPPVQPGIPSALLRRRPDVAAAERAVAAADSSLAVARDQMLPVISLTTSLGRYAHDLPDLTGSPYQLWSVGGSILAPLFDGGRLRAQAVISATLRDRALFAYEAAVRNAFADTENALDAVQRLRDQLEQAEARSVAAEASLRIAHDRYRNGYSSYLEELDAQRTSFMAGNAVLQLRASWLAAHVDLYRALGGGWNGGGFGGASNSSAYPEN